MSFNLDLLMQSSVTGALDTRIPAWPAGEYIARIDKVELAEWSSKDKGTSGAKLNVTWKTDNPTVCTAVGVPAGAEAQTIHGIMLDLTETGNLDLASGKNTRLGKLREAVNQNDPTKPWMFGSLVGQVARIRTEQRVYEGDTFTDVKAVSAI